MLAVRDGVDAEQVTLQTTLEAVAVKIDIPVKATVCSIYIPPNEEITRSDIEDLLEQLPGPVILAGDLNAKNELWSNDDDARGRTLASTFEETNLVVLNDGADTYQPHQACQSPSTPDITACSAPLASRLNWKLAEDVHSSDHFPILVGFSGVSVPEKRRQSWIIPSADWNKFELDVYNSINPEQQYTIEELTAVIISAAEASIPKTKEDIHPRSVPWWNERVAEAVKQRRRALRQLQSVRKQRRVNETLIQAAHEEFKQARMKARKVIEEEKSRSWQEYVSTINEDTPPSEMWRKIRSISGKRSSTRTWSVKVGDRQTSDSKEIAEHLAEFFEQSSSDSSYPDDFRTRKTRVERRPFSFPGDRGANYLQTFSKDELLTQLNDLSGSSPGPDGVHNTMLQHLPAIGKDKLLDAYNSIWTSNTFPATWKETILVPIPKPGKNPNIPGNLRPIHLSSCVLKLFERMINRRLMDTLEERNVFGQHQAAFRKGRQTLDTLASIESYGKNAIATKKHAEFLFLDIEKAYDRTWRRLILEGLAKARIGGHMASFCSRFLEDRRFRVHFNGEVSSLKVLQNGVPQGSVLAVTFFLLAIDSIRQYIDRDVFLELFADDITLGVSDVNVRRARQKLQTVVNAIARWSKETGFKVAISKTAAMHVCFKRFHAKKQPTLKLENQEVEFVGSHKVLGVWLDYRLSFKRHLAKTKAECRRGLNLMRCLGKTKFGADRVTMIHLIRATLLPKLLYGIPITSGAGESEYMKLAPVYHEAIRLATGAYRSSPIDSILADSGLLPFNFLVDEHLILYSTRQLARNRINRNYPVALRARTTATKLNVNMSQVIVADAPAPNDWVLKRGTCRADRFGCEPPAVQRAVFRQTVGELYPNHAQIFTDGSLNETGGVGCGVYSSSTSRSITLPSQLTIFSAEAYAILEAIELAKRNPHQTVIFSDSKSVISAVKGHKTHHPWVVKIRRELARLRDSVELCWVPAHCDIDGNEKADELAKTGASSTQNAELEEIPYPDFKLCVKKLLRQRWNQLWYSCDTKLRRIKESSTEWLSSRTLTRRDSRAITRLRIGHTHLTHGHLMANCDPEPCETCGETTTVQHILVDCRKFEHQREESGIANSLYVALGDNLDEIGKTLEFLRISNLYCSI